MRVIKRNGRFEEVQFDKITERIRLLSKDLSIDPVNVARMVCSQIVDNIKTSELDILSANVCASLSVQEPEYEILGSRLLITNHEKETDLDFVTVVRQLQNNKDILDEPSPILNDEFVNYIEKNADKVSQHFLQCISNTPLYQMSMFGWKTLCRSYLMKSNRKIVERPEHLFYRVALFLHYPNLEKTQESYSHLAQGHFIHATPTLFHAGTKRAQMSSCFHGDTLVNTLRGPVPIRDVLIGDEVITHTGKAKKVVQTHENLINGRRLFKVCFKQTPSFIVTEDHPLYIYNTHTKEIGWKDVINLEENDYVMIPNYNGDITDPVIDVQKLLSKYNIEDDDIDYIYFQTYECLKRQIHINECFMKFLAIFLITGNFDRNNDGNICGLSMFHDNIDICKELLRDMEIDVKPSYSNDMITLSSPILGLLFYNFITDFKHIPKEIYRYSTNLINVFVDGLTEVTDDNNICSISKTLLEDIFSLCRLHGITTVSIHKFYKQEEQAIITIDNNTFVKFDCKSEIKSIDERFVFTLGVEDDHSYSVEGIIAKNCFLMGTEDNVDGIYKTITDVAKISKWAGGIGVHISNIRAKNSYIRGTNGQSNGIMPMLRVYNDTSRYIDQCVHGYTKVYTKNGVKPIYLLEPGKDEILQRDGNFEVLEKQLEHVYKGEILQFSFENGSTIQITPEHPILGNDKCWVDAIDLRVGDKILFPVPKYTKDILSYNETLLTCWGLFMGLGKMTFEDSYAIMNFPIKMNPKYKELFQYMLSSNLINYQDYLFNDGYQIRFDRNHLSPLRYSLLYNSDGKKQIHSSILHLPLTKLHKFIIGFLTSILSFDEKYYHLSLIDFSLDDIIYIFSRFSIPIKIYDGIILIPKNSIQEDQYNIPGEFLENTIIDVKKDHFDGVLYDLEFKQEHSYTITSSIIHNGGGKRKGSFALYIEPWHGDIYDFIMAKRNVGNEDERARDLFYGLWIPDLFMKRVEEDGMWSLMCPDRCKGLNECYGKEFEKLYENYESQNKYIRQIKARDLWKEILNSQIETGLPYMCYKDSVNVKSNQQNIGIIKSSNLCCEINEVSNSSNYAVCNLASINLSNCVKEKPIFNQKMTIYTKKWCVYCILIKKRLERKGIKFTSIDADENPDEFENVLKKYPSLEKSVPKICVGDKDPIGFFDFWNTYLKPDFDFEELQKRVQVLVINMNKVIDKNYYPTEETKRSNLQNRPIGLGVQGLADLFCRLYINFDSEEARYLNRKIFETMYYTALKTSNQYCIDNNLCYSSFKGSPLSQGIFHFELCSNFNKNVLEESPKYDWEGLRKDIIEKGISNSLFLAPMPTASTSQILNQNECIEPYTSNLYVRRTLAGEFTITNKYLTQDLRDVGLWNKNTIDHLIVSKGSIQRYIKLPKTIRDIFRTAWEIPQKSLIDMAGERQWFIDQSQSFNLFVAEPSLDKLTKMHFYGWKKGLKTGSYYIRTKPQHFSQNFTVDPSKEKEEEDGECLVCSA